MPLPNDPAGGGADLAAWRQWLMQQLGPQPLPGATPATPVGASTGNAGSWNWPSLFGINAANAAEAPPPSGVAAAATIPTTGIPPVPAPPAAPGPLAMPARPTSTAPMGPVLGAYGNMPYPGQFDPHGVFAPKPPPTDAPYPPVKPKELTQPSRPVTPTPASAYGKIDLGYYRPTTGIGQGGGSWTPYGDPRYAPLGANDPRIYKGPLSMFGKA